MARLVRKAESVFLAVGLLLATAQPAGALVLPRPTPEQIHPAQAAVPAVAPGVMPLTAAELGELKAEGPVPCQDGSFLTVQVYDPDPSDPDAIVYVFRRGEVLVALRQKSSTVDRVYLAASAQWVSTEEARSRYGSPCNIPTSGR